MTIVVAGEALVDLLLRDDGSVAATPGGGPFNTARTLGRLGAPVQFAGALASDRFGRRMSQMLRDDGVGTALVQPSEHPTTLAVAEIDRTGAATYRFYAAATSAPTLAPFELPPGASALHIGTLGIVLEPMATAVEQVVASMPEDVALMIDVNHRPAAVVDGPAHLRRLRRLLRRADVVKVSTDDVLGLVGAEQRVDEALVELTAGGALVLHTDGAAPVRIRTAADDVLVEVPTVDVVDTVGAGDAFGGGFLADAWERRLERGALRDASQVLESVRFGVRVAALTCGRAGADPPRRAELAGDDGRAG